MKKAGLIGLGLTLLLTLPILFVLTRGTVSTNQFIVIVIVGVVLLFLIWTVLYALLVDPLLRRWLATSSTWGSNGAYRASQLRGHQSNLKAVLARW